MFEYSGIIFLLVACWLLQIGLSYYQHRNYNRILNQIKQRQDGYLGVGVAKARFKMGKGVITLLVTDATGRILDYREMSGFTVFARFKAVDSWIGKETDEALQEIKGKQRIQAFTQALELINKEIARKAEGTA